MTDSNVVKTLLRGNEDEGNKLPHDESRGRRRGRRSLAANSESMPMHVSALYQGYGTHYVDLWVGTPPVRQTLVVDTGSGVTAFPCSECIGVDCGEGVHLDPVFDETKSSSYVSVGCDECQRGHCDDEHTDRCVISMRYANGASTFHAYESIDRAYLGGPHNFAMNEAFIGDTFEEGIDLDPFHAKAHEFDLRFGCQYDVKGLLQTQMADGILGLDHARAAVWNQMAEQQILKRKAFSLCYGRQQLPHRSGTEAGAITMGGSESALHKTPLVYTSHRNNPKGGYFSVQIRKIHLREGNSGESARSTNPDAAILTVDADDVSLNYGSVRIDSGTTDTYFNKRIAEAFENAYRDLTGQEFDYEPKTLSEEELMGLPTILVQLKGDVSLNENKFPEPDKVVGLAGSVDPENPHDVILAIPPTHYMEWEPEEDTYVFRLYTDQEKGSVLGANALMGHDVFFDLSHKRISFAESTCEYTALVQKKGFDFQIEVEEEASLDEEELLEEEEEHLKEEAEDGPIEVEDADLDADLPDEAAVDDDYVEAPEEIEEDDGDSVTQQEQVPSKKDEAKASVTVHPAIEACSDWACRGTVVGVLLAFLMTGIAVGQYCQQRKAWGAYHRPEDMVPSAQHDDDDDDDEHQFAKYRDSPEEDEEEEEEADQVDQKDHHVEENGFAMKKTSNGISSPKKPKSTSSSLTNGHKFDDMDLIPIKVV